MSKNHEYALLDGINRSTVGRYIFAIASALSAALVSLIIVLINWWQKLGLLQFPQVIIVPLTAGIVYACLYYVFKNKAWKWHWVAKFISIPDLSGAWEVEGETLNPKPNTNPTWVGKIIIYQDWDLIRVCLQTEASKSESIAAALQFDQIYGYHLLYTYRNEPKADSPSDMQSHRGAVHLTFNPDLTKAEGDYFNGRGRYSFGTMRLSRSETD